MTVKKASIKIIRREQVEYISRDKYEKVDPLNLTRLHRQAVITVQFLTKKERILPITLPKVMNTGHLIYLKMI